MKPVMKMLGALTLGALLSATTIAQEKNPVNLDQLLKQLEQGTLQQNKQNAQREKEFASKQAQQDSMLKDAEQNRNNELARSERLETTFEENEFKLGDLNDALSKRLGSLKELFGVLQQVSGGASKDFMSSVVSAEIPGRSEFLDTLAQDMGKSSKLASIEEIERVWFELQREMTESGKVTSFKTAVVEADGKKVEKEVYRVGTFALVSEGNYLDYSAVTQTVSELQRQPQARYGNSVAALEASSGELVQFGLDPTGGSIMKLQVLAPNLRERIDQGGAVGYTILAVGFVALIIALWRFIVLFSINAKVNKQLKDTTPTDNNPLGRVLLTKDKYPEADVEALELHLTEAILGELPNINRSLQLIKIISVVAPLMGLLGTVTGMIETFQAITLYGTGDPKLMAGGISGALVTTVLGLVVAIPSTLLFALLNTRAKNIVYILQEQAAGIVAERAEKG